MAHPFIIGQNLTDGDLMRLKLEDMLHHWLILGGTGSGKSKLSELRMRYHLDNRQGFIFLDPHGTLFDSMLSYVAAAGYRNRVIVIDANDPEYSVGLNFLSKNHMDVSAHASQVMKAIAKVFGEADGEVKPRLERWQRNVLMSLIEADLTLADMLDFLSVSNSVYRQSVVSNVRNEYVRREWQGFDTITKRADKENLIEAPLNRAAKMILSDPIRRIIGQRESTIDFAEAVESGKAIMVNLAPLRVSRECQQILAILLVDQIINYAFQRTKKQSAKPFFVIADEAAEMTSNDLPYSLQALRKFGIFFTLCYQTLAQIRRIPGYYENVMTNCNVKIAFKSSRRDSEELIGELFAGEIHGNLVKQEIYHTVLIPQETTREVRSTSRSTSHTRGESVSEGTSESSGSGVGSSYSSGSGYASHLMPADGLFHQMDTYSFTNSDSIGSASGEFSSSASGWSSNKSDTTSDSESESSGSAIVPFYEYLREQELSSRTYYSIEEMKEKYIAWIMCQPQRHVYIKLKNDKAVPVFISFVQDVPVREKERKKVIRHSNNRYAMLAQAVDGLLEDRRQLVIHTDTIGLEAIEEEEAIRNQRWQ